MSDKPINHFDNYHIGRDIFAVQGYYSLKEFVLPHIMAIPCTDSRHVFVPFKTWSK